MDKGQAVIDLLLPGEQAVQVQGASRYYITDRGRVLSIGGQRKPMAKTLVFNDKTSYYGKTQLVYDDGKARSVRVHILVAKHFLPDYDDKLCVLHRDEGLPHDIVNGADNLWMGTLSDNRRDCLDKGRGTMPVYRGGRKAGTKNSRRLPQYKGKQHRKDYLAAYDRDPTNRARANRLRRERKARKRQQGTTDKDA